MLVRLPRGFGPGHPAEKYLRYQSFTVSRMLTDEQALGPTLPALLERTFRPLVPFVRWLNHAIGLKARASR